MTQSRVLHLRTFRRTRCACKDEDRLPFARRASIADGGKVATRQLDVVIADVFGDGQRHSS
jgi:hypothetical protein